MRFWPCVRRSVFPALLVLMTVTLLAAIAYGPPAFVTTGQGPASLAVADFNGDGRLDFASANWNAAPGSELTVRFGDGAGAFPTGSSFAGPAVPRNIAAADMDNDSDVDLVLTTHLSFAPGSANAVILLLNDGTGTFAAAAPALKSCLPPPQETTCDQPSAVALADVNEDGDMDIVVAAANAVISPLIVFLADGSGGFAAPAYPAMPAGTGSAYDVVVADFNGDNDADLGLAISVPTNPSTGVAWMLGNGNGTFAAATVFTFPNTLNGEHGAIAITAGDIDHDGDIDTATVAGNVLHGASVFLNNGTGTAAGMTWTRFSMPQAPANPVDVVLADLDGDANVDILTVDQFGIPPWGDNLAARAGNGDGTFGAPVAISVGYVNGLESHWNPRGIAAVDLTCDGKADLIAGHEATFYASVMIANGPAGVCGDTPPTITAPPDVTVNASSCPVHIDDGALGTATASDDGGPPTVVRSGVPAGNNFPLGVTIVTYTATDGTGQTATDTQMVTVIDNTPPSITAPANISVTAGPSCVAAVNPGTATATDGCGSAVVAGTRSDGQPLLAPYPIGTTTIAWTATDPSGNSSTATQIVSVAAPPAVISDAAASPASLWPPNHKMVDVTIDYTVDACGSVTCVISSIASDEPVNGLGDGDAAPDWEIVDTHHVRLRAERAGGGDGRVYTITIACTNTQGHTTTKAVSVTVGHNK